MDRTFKISDEFCLFKGDILDYYNPDIDETKISKVIDLGLQYVQSCNEHKLGELLQKYPEFLVANNCEIIERVKEGDIWLYKDERDQFIFEECEKTIDASSDKVEVYVYNKSGNDLQYYMDNPPELEKLLTRNNSMSIFDGVNELIIHFTNILSILKYEGIIHKDIKPGNIIVGDDLHNFPNNIRVIDLGFSFRYEDFTTFLFQQSIDLLGEQVYENAVDEFGDLNFYELAYHFSLDYYKNKYTNKYSDHDIIFSVLTGIATPKYSSPEFDLRISKGLVSPTLGTLICVDPRTFTLDLRQDIPDYIIKNSENINYTELVELFTYDSDVQDRYFNIVKDNKISKSFIESLLDYNQVHDTNYNLFEYVYMMVNGLMGDNPLIYNYDLYAFGLILKEVVNSYMTALQENKLFDPRKSRAKRTKSKRRMTGGFKTIMNSKINYKEVDILKYVIMNMSNVDSVYRWSIDDILSFYDGNVIPNEKYINIKGTDYKLCHDKVTRESIIEQFKIINPEYYEYIPQSVENDDWEQIRQELETLGFNRGKSLRTIARMKRNKISSIQELNL